MTAHAPTQRRSLCTAALFAMLLAALVLPASLFAAQPVAGQTQPRLVMGGDPVINPATLSGHGWVFLPGQTGDDGAIVHLVPRQGVLRASPGSVRHVMQLQRTPLAIAGWSGTAFMLLGPPGDEATTTAERQISILTATGPIAHGTWSYAPSDRLELKAPLPGDAIPRSMTATEHGPLIVWQRGPSLEIAILDDNSTWRTIQPPEQLTAADEAFALTAGTGITIAARSKGQPTLTIWHATVNLSGLKPKSSTQQLPAQWSSVATAMLPGQFSDTPLRTLGHTAPHWLWRDGPVTLLAARQQNTFTLWRLDTDKATQLWQSKPTPDYAGAAVIGGLGAATFVGYKHAEHTPAPTTGLSSKTSEITPPDFDSITITDVSAIDGAVLADVTGHADGLLSRRDLQFLWLLFIAVGIVILLVVLRSDGPQEITLPEHTSLASPLRRFIAGGLDVVIALTLTTILVGSGPAQWLSPATSATSSIVPLLSVIFLGFLVSTIGEGFFGCSPGKLLTGVRILGLVPVKAEPGAPKDKAAPTLWRASKPRFSQALLRNAIRWFMPPMGMMMIVDTNWRHPGDILARTVAVVHDDPEDQPQEGGDGFDDDQ